MATDFSLDWVRGARETVRPNARDAVARARMSMQIQPFMALGKALSIERVPLPSSDGANLGFRSVAVIQPLPPIAGPPTTLSSKPVAPVPLPPYVSPYFDPRRAFT